MTTLRNSQLVSVGVAFNLTAADLRDSQLISVGIAANPAAADLRVSQLVVIAVIANGEHFQPLGPVIGLGCWTPCGNLAWNGE